MCMLSRVNGSNGAVRHSPSGRAPRSRVLADSRVGVPGEPELQLVDAGETFRRAAFDLLELGRLLDLCR